MRIALSDKVCPWHLTVLWRYRWRLYCGVRYFHAVKRTKALNLEEAYDRAAPLPLQPNKADLIARLAPVVWI